jgi:RNA polymerase-binding transcription factor DksA
MTGIAERPTISSTKQALTPRQRTALRSHLAGDREKTRLLIEQIGEQMSAFMAARRDTATDDEHDPEGPTLAFERSQSSAMLAQSEQHLADIDAALLRLELGTYGLCMKCRSAIAVGRLQVRPQASLCIHCAENLR